MKLIVLAIRDSASEVFGQPNFVASIGGAVRSFGDEVNRDAQDNSLYQHPDDFEMYELGTFDNTTARFELLDSPRMVARAKDQVRK